MVRAFVFRRQRNKQAKVEPGKLRIQQWLLQSSIFQTAIILFYVSLSVKGTAETVSIPIQHHHDDSGSKGATKYHAADPNKFANPLPHVLMLTAIVVGVATLGVALAVSQLLYKDYGTLEEDEILTTIRDMPPDHG